MYGTRLKMPSCVLQLQGTYVGKLVAPRRLPYVYVCIQPSRLTKRSGPCLF